MLNELKDTTASIYFVPDMFVTDLIQGQSGAVCGVPVIAVCETPFTGSCGLAKWLSDKLLAAFILILILPIMLPCLLYTSCNRRALGGSARL